MDRKSHRMVYLSRCYRNLTSAGNKAKTDIETSMQEMGFVNIGLPQKVGSNKTFIFFYDLLGVIKACCSLRKGDTLMLQYPLKKYFSLLCNVAHLHGAKVMTVIHDLGSMRRRKLTVPQEIRRLSHADCVIATNSVMEQWLKDNGLKVKTGALGLVDYRSAVPLPTKQADDTVEWGSGRVCKIAYAGSLAMRKNSFFLNLASIVHGYELHIYGDAHAMPSLKDNKAFVFHGFTPADEFIAHSFCDFGLVWDGDSLDTCSGNFGEYLRYNTPHKTSFYLRAGMPVIVWRESAIAGIIEQEGVGFCISSLRELPERLEKITKEEYEAMKKNTLRLAEKINTGGFFKSAVERYAE